MHTSAATIDQSPPARSSDRPQGAQGPPAGRLVVRRLCRRRHHPADRRRGAVRGPRRPLGTEGARRRRRQRQRLARSRPPLVRGGVHRLRAGSARAWPRTRGRPSGLTSSSARPTRKRCRLPTAQFDAVVSTFGVMFTPDQERGRGRAAPGVQAAAARSASPTGRRTGFIGQLFKTHRQVRCRRRPASSRRRSGARGRASRSCSSRHAASIKAEPRNFVFRYRSPEHLLEIFKTYYGPVLKTFAALDAAGQRRSRRSPGADRPVQPRRGRLHGRAQRIPRNRDRQALIGVIGRRAIDRSAAAPQVGPARLCLRGRG